MEHEKWMHEALLEAQKAFNKGEVPIGAVVVGGNRIIGRGHNMTQQLNDVTAHAEMIAITAAESVIGKYLDNCSLYVTLEPCLMCAGAIGWSQLKEIIYGATDPKKGYTTYLAHGKSVLHPNARIINGILKEECTALLSEFFLNKRMKFT